MKRIYLDNNATTAIDPRVLEVVAEELAASPSNPSSLHHFGKEAKKRLNAARCEIAGFFSVAKEEVVFTSGGTESMNFLIQGALQGGGHVISSAIEHACVYETLKKHQGIDLSFLPVGAKGCIHVEDLRSSLRKETRLIVLSAANHETGVKNPIDEIAQIAEEHQVPFIVDGVALLGKELFDLPKGISGIGFSGHKIHAPQGTGFVIVRPSLKLKPLLTGGGQEFGLRAGTENLPGIQGLKCAISLLREELPEAIIRMGSLRDHFEKELIGKLTGVRIHGTGSRIANVSNLFFEGIGGEDLLISLDLAGIAVSHGSACASGSVQPSRVLLEMGIPHEEARSSVRFSLSRTTTRNEIDRCIHELVRIVTRFRS